MQFSHLPVLCLCVCVCVCAITVCLAEDVTPVGRILNRFTQDLDAVDTLLPDSFLLNLQNAFFLLSAFAMCVVVTPFFLALVVPAIGAVYLAQDYFRKSSRELKRLDRSSRSPLFSLFGETLQGLNVIRAFGKGDFVLSLSIERIRANMRNCHYLWMTNRWIAVRVDVMSGSVFFAAAVRSGCARKESVCGVISDSF